MNKPQMLKSIMSRPMKTGFLTQLSVAVQELKYIGTPDANRPLSTVFGRVYLLTWVERKAGALIPRWFL